MNLSNLSLLDHYGPKPVPKPYTQQKIQTGYLVLVLDLLSLKELGLQRKHPQGPLDEFRKTKGLKIVEFVYGIGLKNEHQVSIHLFRSLSEREYVNTILKKFPLQTEIFHYPPKGSNERYLLSRRLLATFVAREITKDLKLFSSDPRLIQVLQNNDESLYTKKDLSRAKELYRAHRNPRKTLKNYPRPSSSGLGRRFLTSVRWFDSSRTNVDA